MNTHSAACWMPTSRGRNHDEAASGTIPRRANTKPMRADSDARRTSIGSVMVMPTPTAGPLMAPITGFNERKIRNETSPPPSRGTPAAVSTSEPPRLKVSAPPPRSAPAQNPRPRPVTTTARTSSSRSARSNASTSSYIIWLVNALSRSGRSRVMVATRSATSKAIWVYSMLGTVPGRPGTVPARPGLRGAELGAGGSRPSSAS